MRKFMLRGFVSLLAVLMGLGAFNGGVLWLGKADAAAPFPGSGTASSPYLVGTPEQFDSIRNYTPSKYYFKLTSDIDLSGYSAGTGWVPIGAITRVFYAHLDGDGHKITGLTINDPTADYMGLFGYLGGSYSISNLTLENVSVTGRQYVGGLAGYTASGTIAGSSVSGQVTGSTEVGGLVGANYGSTIGGSHSSANVSGTSHIGGLIGEAEMSGSAINNSYATGDITGANGGEAVGGLVGLTGTGSAPINNSYASGRVTGDSMVGGLIGEAVSVNIGNSYSAGEVNGSSNVGGLVGYSASTATIGNSYASGAVSGTSSAGGLVGYKNYNLTIKNSYASGLVNEGVGSTGVGGLVGDGDPDVGGMYAPVLNSFYDSDATGQSVSAGGTGVATSQMKDAGTFGADAANAWDFTAVWALDPTRNGGYPYLLATQAYLDYDGNGGVSGSVPPSRSYIPGERAAVDSGTMVLDSSLTALGYRFYGWNTAADGTGATYRPGDSITITSNTTLYAYWILPSSDASLAFTIGTVSANGTSEETVTDIPYGTTLSEFKTAVVPASGATFEIYESDGTTVATRLATGDQMIVTAEDGVTKVTYTLTVSANGAKDITSFSLAAQTRAATINAASHTVSLQVAYGTDRSCLAATFSLSADASAKVGGVDQVSGATLNDFTSPVTYKVQAGDGSTQDWTVTVTVAPNSAKDIASFSFPEQTGPATINSSAHAVSIQVAYGTSLNGLVASFALSPGAAAKVGTATQVSGTTANDFSSPVTYKVTAENGSSQSWKVTVTVAVNDAKDFTAFSLAEQTGAAVIDAAAHTVSIEVANGTDLSNLAAAFALSAGASAKVGTAAQVSGTTANDFTTPVTYIVTATDGSSQIWTVTVTVAAAVSSAKDITAFSLAEQSAAAVIDATAHTVSIEVANGTDAGSLVAAFALSAGASAKVGAAAQVSGTTANDFTSPVTYEVTAEDGSSQNWTVTVTVAKSNAATLTSAVGTVSSNGTANETITNIPYGTTLAAFKAAITPAAKASFNVYDSDGTSLATVLETGKKVIVTAEDGVTRITYTVTVNAAPPINDGGGSVPTTPVTNPSDGGSAGNPSSDEPADDPTTQPQQPTSFSDIIGHWAEAAIQQGVQSGIVTGYPDGTFKPNQPVTREEFAVMLIKALKPQSAGAELIFTDKDKIGAWAREAVAQAVQEGIIKGYVDGSFRPDAEITRTEMIAMIANALKLTAEAGSATGFADDKDIPAWARGAIAAIKNLGIVQGAGENRFHPNVKATRAEAITVLVEMLARLNRQISR
ncbi:S-layer homology domain-containing protein [Cohnella zeiphila]|uniref:S-layer homology domain-containing protein n=1 Tax=Cohnella zeiphila TaxID=2761120 RepID=A0A7X0SS81_9BACL|nr:S-layer homology domain-containing protein [Cohnella zeiphila]MBB6734144.1 S-layer homology domain-containing protein [Cohnella zeiphila]